MPAAEMPPMTGSVLDTPLPPGEPLPFPNLDGFKDNTDLYEESDSPVFWHIPKAGESTVKDIMVSASSIFLTFNSIKLGSVGHLPSIHYGI